MSDWIICPVLDLWEYTRDAIVDCLAQRGVDVQLIVVNQGSSDLVRTKLENWATDDPRLHIITHDPPLPSLACTWNKALEAVWWMERENPNPHALVVNNDVRLHRHTYRALKGCVPHVGWFVSGVGVTAPQFNPEGELAFWQEVYVDTPKAGPDFSCYVIGKRGHEKYPFDEAFVPAYCEDVDLHRRMLLGGDGDRIFGVNVPFLHFGSRTINRTPEAAKAFSSRYEACVEYYKRKWGGRPNEETFTVPFGKPSRTPDVAYPGCLEQEAGVTTPELQRRG